MSHRLLAILAVLALAPRAARAEPPTLPAYNAEIGQTSISGISSGAFMAVQFATAWSSIVVGVGAIAGGPYGCSQGSASAALSSCMLGSPPIDLTGLLRRVDEWSGGGAIDATTQIARQRVYLFNGYNDSVVARPVSNALAAFYAHYRPASLFYQTAIGAGHSQVTLAYGGGCADNGGEFINRCGYDQAGVILQHIYGALRPRNAGTPGGHIISFRQADFTGGRSPSEDSLDDTGFAFVPASCAARQACRVHIALHGCLQSYADIGEDFVRHAGYNEWADTNRIIVLYPQTHALALRNPQSCWDWWGYLDSNPTEQPHWLLQSGRQIGVLKAMIDRLTSGATVLPAEAGTTPALRAIDASDSAIDLAWTAVGMASSYEVFRAGPGEATFHPIATVAALSYGDAGLRPGSEYRYQVRAAGGGFSPSVARRTRRPIPPCAETGTCPVR